MNNNDDTPPNQNDQVAPETLLIKAMSAGAVVSFRPNLLKREVLYEDIIDAYEKLKNMIAAGYAQVDVDILEIGPGSAERKEVLARQLVEAGVPQDDRIMRQAQVLMAQIEEEDPEAFWAAESTDPPPQHT